MDELQEARQRALCARFDAPFAPALPHDKLGIAASARSATPLHGLRHPIVGDTCGWYIWGGELSDDPSFFKPIHMAHIADWCAAVIPYLGLPAGWRFLIAEGHEDVWFDASLLNAKTTATPQVDECP
jgi:hypothetical protein